MQSLSRLLIKLVIALLLSSISGINASSIRPFGRLLRHALADVKRDQIKCLLHVPKALCNKRHAKAVSDFNSGSWTNVTVPGPGGVEVAEFKGAATYVYVDQYGKATISSRVIGAWAHSIIRNCDDNGRTAGILVVPKSLYEAHGFHPDDETVYVAITSART